VLAKKLISKKIPYVNSNTLGKEILNIMKINEVSFIPIVDNKEFIGLISESELIEHSFENKLIKNFKFPTVNNFVYENQHIFEIIEKFVKLNLTAIVVLNKDDEYFGVISSETLISGFSKLTSMHERGALIVLEMNSNDYSLIEISQIIEGNDAKILSLYIEMPNDSSRLELTLKINTSNLSSIIQSLERYNYFIKSMYFEDKQMNNFYKNRYDEFMNYINIS